MRQILSKYKRTLLLMLAVVGPGIITSFADNDAGGVATYSVAASKFGYGILFTLIPITLVLMFTQEIGARLAIVSEKGLGDLIRERFGIRISILVFSILALINFGVILQDMSGLKSAMQLFHLNIYIFLPLAVVFLFALLAAANYSRIEHFFLVLIAFYITYFFSAILAKPDWQTALGSLVVPPPTVSFDYIFTSVAVLGTTVTAWGQFFINSYVKDKKISQERLKYSRAEVYTGSILASVVSLFIMVAVAATVFQNNIPIRDAAEAALAIQPFAGAFASSLFGIGLFIAGFLGCAIVPLATTYAFSEFFGFEGSLDTSFRQSKTFYTLFLIQIILGMLVVFLPNISLFQITLVADFLNGIFLPVIFFFLYKFANNEELMGQHRNSRLQNALLLGTGSVITVASLLGVLGKVF